MGSDDLNGMTGYVWDLSKSPAHAMTFGPTRKGGKGTSAIIPALLTYTAGSTFTIDPKAENAWASGERLRSQGKRVVIMDPWDEINRRYASKAGVSEPVTRFNPLYALDPASPDFADEVAAIADALIVVADGRNKHFDESARELVAGLIAASVEKAPGSASFRDVRQLLCLGDEVLAKVVAGIVEKTPDSLAARKLGRFTMSNDEIRSVRSTALTQTAFLDSETLLRGMESDEQAFDLAELATSRVALFLVLPVDRLETHGRWLRMIVTLAIRAIARQDAPPKAPVLFLLDEMGTIGRLSQVETAYGLMAGLGIRLWGFFQDLGQLQSYYQNTWETFISNSSVVQILKAHDIRTSEYVSKFMGNGTVNAKTGGWTYKQVRWSPGELKKKREWDMNFIKQSLRKDHSERELRTKDRTTGYTLEQSRIMAFVESREKDRAERGMTPFYKTEWVPDEQLVGRPLMDPDEVRRLDDDLCLILTPGELPHQQFRTVYYKHPLFDGLYRDNPYFAAPAKAPA
jgi:type IV secretory pathway TraG/TraD family ATPase VirD4